MYHFRKTIKLYRKRKKETSSSCPFCNETYMKEKTIKQNEHARVIPNLTFYDLWEMRDVTDHLMIVPKRHVTTLKELTPAERTDVMDLMAEYEAQDYNIYARSPKNVLKSVPHQHTHLIKTVGKKHRALIALEKPYLVLRIK